MTAKRFFSLLTLPLLGLLISGCASSEQWLEEHKQVTTSSSEDLFMLVRVPLVYNDDDFDPSVGVSFFPGRFVLEAEDEDYWYFHAPQPLNVLTYSFGKITGGVRFIGGIVLSKSGSNAKPSFVYVNGENENDKVVLWKLSRKFMMDRGNKWSLSLDSTDTVPSE